MDAVELCKRIINGRTGGTGEPIFIDSETK